MSTVTVRCFGFSVSKSITVLHACGPRQLRFAPHILIRKVLNDSFCFGTQKRRRTHSKLILHRCKIYSTTRSRIYGICIGLRWYFIHEMKFFPSEEFTAEWYFAGLHEQRTVCGRCPRPLRFAPHIMYMYVYTCTHTCTRTKSTER